MAATAPSARDKGLELLRQGMAVESIDWLQQAIDEEPADTQLHMFMALAYAKSDSIDKAIEVLEKAVDLAPTSAQLHYNLGVAYSKAHNTTLAKDEFMRALGLDPAYAAAKQALEGISQNTEQPPQGGMVEA